ncbi:MAG: hypothetical protein ABSB82_06370 [Terriglobia bacterium]|jgi:hypothetical protein
MSKEQLRVYFETERGQIAALEAAKRNAWLDPLDNIVLYTLSRCAFDAELPKEDACRCFENIYYRLTEGRWGAFRPAPRAQCWRADKIFETTKKEFQGLSRTSPVNLLNFEREGTEQSLKSGLAKMQDIKPKRGYPIMTVSKFLHVYNPGLFPIYDTAVIWNRVCNGRFKNDYREFGRREKIPDKVWFGDSTLDFIPYYMRWASSLVSTAHQQFMHIFAEWFEHQCFGIVNKQLELTTLYATAFEFTLIGAAET